MIEGDHDAFRYFFETYYDDLCNFVNIYIKDEIIAEEIVQEIYIYMWENKEKLKINTSFKSYLFNASKYQSLNFLRNQRKRSDIIEKLSFTKRQWEEIPNGLFFESDTLKEILGSAIDSLPEKCRQIFLLSKVDGLSHKEIAEKLNVSIKTIENQITIAFKKLRTFLHPYKDELLCFIFSLWLLS